MIPQVLNNERLWHVETTDVLAGLRSLPDSCVQCVVTSPPYWGLRDYGTPPSVWGGKDDCEHEWAKHVQPAANGILRDGGMSGETLSGTSATRKPKASAFCARCGAWRGSYGLEPTPAMFVANTVAIFREVRRVLRDDGTCWLNIGDSWNAYNGGGGPGGWNDARDSERPTLETGYGLRDKNLKPKDICGIPWRVALALQDDGWYLRQDIIWAKPNGMPESVRDRCTKAHEYIFLLAKSERYYYDAEAIKQPPTPGTLDRLKSGPVQSTGDGQKAAALGRWGGKREYVLANAEAGSNRRSVWTIPVGNYSDAHFATFPLALPETCLKAGTADRGCCPTCGTPWQRITERERIATRPGINTKVNGKTWDRDNLDCWPGPQNANVIGNRDPQRHTTTTRTTGWQPGCECGGEPIPCLTLDPFSGAGTTGLVAAKGLGLRYIGLELNPKYADMSRRRIAKGFCEPTPKVEPIAGQRELFA